jgi:solute carrier family 25, member 39/40
MSSSHVPFSSIPFLLSIVRTEGSSALFTGIFPRIAKIAPACGIMIASFEVCPCFLGLSITADEFFQGVGKFLTYE